MSGKAHKTLRGYIKSECLEARRLAACRDARLVEECARYVEDNLMCLSLNIPTAENVGARKRSK